MAITRTDTDERFDKNGNVVASTVVVRDITAPTIDADIQAKMRAALAGNTAALDTLTPARNQIATALTNCDAIIAAPVTNVAQAEARIDALAGEIKRIANVLDGTVVQTGRMLRMNSQLIRKLLGGDLLTENVDT